MTIDDLVTRWREMRVTFRQQLDMLETGKMHTGGARLGSTTPQTIALIKRCDADLSALISAYGHAA